jgi:hypothetical protein
LSDMSMHCGNNLFNQPCDTSAARLYGGGQSNIAHGNMRHADVRCKLFKYFIWR